MILEFFLCKLNQFFHVSSLFLCSILYAHSIFFCLFASFLALATYLCLNFTIYIIYIFCCDFLRHTKKKTCKGKRKTSILFLPNHLFVCLFCCFFSLQKSNLWICMFILFFFSSKIIVELILKYTHTHTQNLKLEMGDLLLRTNNVDNESKRLL